MQNRVGVTEKCWRFNSYIVLKPRSGVKQSSFLTRHNTLESVKTKGQKTPTSTVFKLSSVDLMK